MNIGLVTLVVVVAVVSSLGILKLESSLPPDFFDLSKVKTAALNSNKPASRNSAPRSNSDLLRITTQTVVPSRWEYLVETYRVSEVLGIAGVPTDKLDEFGSQGWEAISIEARGNNRVVMIFKRPAR